MKNQVYLWFSFCSCSLTINPYYYQQITPFINNKPALGFLQGGASSSDVESSLLDSAAAAGAAAVFAGAGFTGACENIRAQKCNFYQMFNSHFKFKCVKMFQHTLGGSSSSESDELSSLLLSCFFCAAPLGVTAALGAAAAPAFASNVTQHLLHYI